MNGSASLVEELARPLLAWAKVDPYTKAVICPPFPYLTMVKQALFDSDIALGGQDCHAEESGAYTGDISADMLVDTGSTHVILGHSERRHHYAEADELIERKASAAIKAGLTPVVCVGESLAEREDGKALERVVAQAKASVPAGQKSEINPCI